MTAESQRSDIHIRVQVGQWPLSAESLSLSGESIHVHFE
jgi:hypothetical protein